MLTVTRLTSDLARTLDFHTAIATRQTQGHGQGGGVRGGLETGQRAPRLNPGDDSDTMNHGGGGIFRRTRAPDTGLAGGGIGGGGGGIGITAAGPRAQTLTARADPQLMSQYLRPIKREKSICEAILDYFFA